MADNLKVLVEKLLKEAKPVFEKIDSIGMQMRDTDDLDKQFYYDSLRILTGCYTYLSPRFKKLRAVKINQEVGMYVKLKLKANQEGVKFYDAQGKQEASQLVKDLRLGRDIFEGYLLAALESVRTCKYYINGYNEEKEATTE